MSEAEELLAYQLKAVGILFQREVRFAPPRRWRADFIIDYHMVDDIYPIPVACHCSEATKVLIEVDGGTWTSSRHTTGAGYRADLEKLNKATELGYRVLRYLPEQVESGEALAQIEKLL